MSLQTDPIKKAEAQIAFHKKEIDELQQFITMYYKLQGHVPTVRTDVSPLVAAFASAPYKSKGEAATGIALDMYAKTQQPVKTRDLLEEMEKQGYKIDGNHQMSVVASYLNERGKLKAERGKGWTPTE